MRGRLIGLALALVATAALAQTQQQRDWCFAPGPTNGQAIEGCTALIDSARETSASKAAAYHHRGFAYERDGWLAWAIADYTEAIALKPDNAGPYDNRAAAYEKKGLRDAAVADYRAALKINPNLHTPREGLKRLGATP
jgi:Flp pilus assembly protein TadD